MPKYPYQIIREELLRVKYDVDHKARNMGLSFVIVDRAVSDYIAIRLVKVDGKFIDRALVKRNRFAIMQDSLKDGLLQKYCVLKSIKNMKRSNK